MLRKKYIIQKSFRVDSQIAEDLEILSEILERSQNDLANIAIEELLLKNKNWFSQNIIVDYCFDYFVNGLPVNEKIESKSIVDGKEVKVTINFSLDIIDDDSKTILKYSVIENDKDILEKTEMLFNNTQEDENKIKRILRELSGHIDINSDTMKNYLEQRLNYK